MSAKFKLNKFVIVMCVLVSLHTLLVMQFDFYKIRALFFDTFIHLVSRPESSKKVVLVDITEQTNGSYGMLKADLDKLTVVAEKLSLNGSKFIISPVNMKYFSYKRNLKELVERLNAIPNFQMVYTQTLDDEKLFQREEPILSKLNVSDDFFMYAIDMFGFAQDNVVRRILLTVDGNNTKGFELAKAMGAQKLRGDFKGQFTATYTHYRYHKNIPAYSIKQLEEDPNLYKSLKDKLVILGFLNSGNLFDYKKTALLPERFETHNMMVIADAYETLIHGDNPKVPAKWVSYGTTFGFVMGLVMLLVYASPMMAAIWSLPYVALIWIFGFLIFSTTDWLIDLAHATVAMAIILFVALPYLVIRFLREKDHELRQKELELVQARVAAKSAKADLGFRIAVQVAHDLRSPLSAIATVAHLAKDDLKTDFYELLSEGVQRLHLLSNDLLERYRTGVNKMNNVNAAIDIEQSIQDLIENYRITFSDVEFQLQLCKQSFISEIGKTSFDRILSNLLTNAVEAVSGKGVVKIKTHSDSTHFFIEVEDSGPGVSKSLQTKLFQEGATEGKVSGTGLGLYSSKKLLQEYSGDLQFLGGSKFSIQFAKEKKSLKLQIPATAKVCIADDDLAIRNLWEHIFKNAGVKSVFVFASVSEFVQHSTYLYPDQNMWVITDLVFDQEDQTGFDVISHFATAGVKNLILCSSLSDNPEVQKISQRFGAKVLGKKQLSQLEVIKI